MKIAIVEDDINMRKSLELALAEYESFDVKTFKNAKEALKGIDDSYELVVTDINMPGMDGIEFLKELGGKYEAVVITGNATLNRAIEALRLGVKDFITKPFEIDTLVSAIKRSQAVTKVTKTSKSGGKEKANTVSLGDSASPTLEKVFDIANRAAVTDATIMLLGESGVGKEVFAKAIHNASKRANNPFIPINMAAIPDNLIESELFGFEKGAFTDATVSKAGKFEEANGGTLFLDEIGEMPFGVQAKLLRVLQEREVTRLGSNKTIKIDVRIISATNANINHLIKEQKFREDLFFRLNTIPIKIPALRERRDDIIPIAEKTILQTTSRYELGTKLLSEAAKKELMNYPWPGNIRELISVCERATILSPGVMIEPDDLFLEHRY